MAAPIGSKNAQKSVKASVHLHVRAKCQDMDKWKAAATLAGLPLSQWVMLKLNS